MDKKRGIMNWCEKRKRGNPVHPQAIIDYCIEKVLPISDDNILHGFTEYKCQTMDIKDVLKDSIFRAHPSFHNNSGQVSGVWYDWALVNINGKKIPCQIMLFYK